MTENLRRRFDQVREVELHGLESAMGITFSELRLVKEAFGQGMHEGTVRFVLGTGEGGVFGELHYSRTLKGRRVAKLREITNPDEAAMLMGLQLEANSKR